MSSSAKVVCRFVSQRYSRAKSRRGEVGSGAVMRWRGGVSQRGAKVEFCDAVSSNGNVTHLMVMLGDGNVRFGCEMQRQCTDA